MSDLYYDAHLTDDERRRLRDCAQISWGHLNAAVESILQARLLDLAQRAEADRAAVERVRALADRWAKEAVERGPYDEIFTDGVAAMLRAAVDPQADQ